MDKNKKKLITFLIPCYNESKNIEKTYKTLSKALKKFKHKYEILMVDDGSKDNSFEIIKKIGINNKNVLPKKNITNLGLGKTYFKYVQHVRGKYYMLINGDNTEPENSIKKILSKLGKAEIIIPYFGDLDSRSNIRTMISQSYTFLVNLILGLKISYYNGPVVHLTKNLEKLKNLNVSVGYGYQTEILAYLLKKKKSKFEEIKIKNFDRTEGISKAFKFKNIVNVMFTLLNLFKYRFYE